MRNTQTPSYRHIQKQVDILVAKNGSEKAFHILETATRTQPIPIGNKDPVIVKYIINTTVQEFGLIAKRLTTDNTNIYRQARECCYYLIAKHTSYSYRSIAQRFNCISHGTVQYGIKRAHNIFRIPKIDTSLSTKYLNIHNAVLKFIKESSSWMKWRNPTK